MRLGSASVRLTLVAGFCALGCATRPGFTRPERSGAALTIRGEGSGREYADCRTAVEQEALSGDVVVLTFGPGVHACGDELALPDRVILRGAGFGRTFLDAGAGKLTSLKPGRYLRASDLAFGGTTPQSSGDARVELVRVAGLSSRGALFGGAQGLTATVVAVHSVLSAWPTEIVPEDATLPVPLALRGNDRVVAVESLLFDVEQEFERMPSPGSIVMLSRNVEAAWRDHQPAAKSRNSSGGRANLSCDATGSMRVACQSKEPGVPGDDALALAGQEFMDGKALATIETHLRWLSVGFGKRFVEKLAPQVRQVELFWYGEAHAVSLESEAAGTDPGASLAAVLRAQGLEFVKDCGLEDVAMRGVLAPVKSIDRFLGSTELTDACRAKLQPRLDAIAARCETGTDWERTLADVSDADATLGFGGDVVNACRGRLQRRLEAIAAQGPLALSYAHELEAVLSLGAKLPPRPTDLRFDVLAPRLPYVLTRSGRTTSVRTPPTVRDRLLRRLQIPGIGDGRRLTETTAPCKVVAGGGTQRGVGRMQLTEEHPGGRSEDTKVVVELEHVVTVSDIPPGTPDGAIAVTLAKRCDETITSRYEPALDRFLMEELMRQVAKAPDDLKAEADVAVLVVAGPDAAGFRWVPVNDKALRALQLELVRNQPALSLAP